jgi:hypothetical protein
MRRKLRQTDSKMIERIAKTWLYSDIGDENVRFKPRFHPNPLICINKSLEIRQPA